MKNPINGETLPLLSFIIGFGVAVMLFHKPFKMKPTLAVPLDEVQKQKFKFGDKCYVYSADDTECEILTSK